jgi:UDP-3-O-[3-hydroxymyristoyl] N-acetylglucosamine deacetylase/3-hydroxyacyl-[acyl-carrier-protein] dehydratase
MSKQTTLAREITLTGPGLHEGIATAARVMPGAENTGIVFVRKNDAGEPVEVPAKPEYLVHRPLRTAIAKDGAEVHTPEHLMAALYGSGIDNARIELEHVEVPSADGSSLPWVVAFREAGIVNQEANRIVFKVRTAASVSDGDGSIVALPDPNPGLHVSYVLDHENPRLRSRLVDGTVSAEWFEKEIAPARTWVLKAQAEALIAAGMGKGANSQNTLIVNDDGSIFENTPRFDDEPARHKLLDLIGDLAMFGMRIEGRVMAQKSGHTLNMELVRELARQQAMSKPLLDINDIVKVLPHRYPFLLIDKVIEMSEKKVVAIKNVTRNEPFFDGHFPTDPLMPGVLQLEAIAQAAGAVLLSRSGNAGKIAVLMSMDGVKFRRPVRPGDVLRIEVDVIRLKSTLAHIKAKATVDGEVASEAEIKFAVLAR